MAYVLDADNALCTIAEAKAHCGVKDTDVSFDDLLTLIINAVSANANEYTNRSLKSRSLTEYHDGTDSSRLLLRNFPVTSTESTIDLRIDEDGAFGVDTKVVSTDIILYPETGKILLRDGCFAKHPRSVKVVYTAGYAAGLIPNRLLLAVLDEVKRVFRRWRDNAEGVQSIAREMGGSVSLTVKDQELLQSTRVVYDSYRGDAYGF